MRPPRLGPLLAALAAVLGASVLVAPAASAGNGPHPGYTIVPPALTPLTVDGAPTRIVTGVLDAAGYAVEVPPHWNGELVMWAHGYRGNGSALTVDAPAYGLRQRLVEQGYAWAASSYDRNGYDVASGVRSTAALAERFGRLVGRPSRTYVAGVSMGGQVIGRSLEQYPGRYDGALPMCGVLGDHDLFDYFLNFQVSAQALAGVRAYPPGPAYATADLPRIYAGLGLAPGNPAVTSPAAQQLRAETVLDSGGERPGAAASFSYWKDFLFSLAAPPTGPSPVRGVALNPSVVATNVRHDYAPDSPVNLDAAVQRVRPADPAARNSRALTPVAQVAGRPRVPVLTLHGVGDLFVPFSMEEIYAGEVAAAGRADRLVQRAIRTTGHCEFSDAEAGAAWDDLVAWTRGGARPAGDDVTAPGDPAFGCRFSDAAAYAAAGPPSQDNTRRLFAPC
jgi:fermentation-respiration switch protein FrsA (DUF1100 family)